MKKIILILFLLLTYSTFSQNVDKITTRCPSPNRSIYSSVLAGNNGDITAVPCPNRSTIFNGNNTWHATTSPYGLFWQPAKPQLAVFDIITPSILGTGIPYFTVGSNTPQTLLNNTLIYGEAHFNVNSASQGFHSGLIIDLFSSNTSGATDAEGIQSYVSNITDTGGQVRLIGVRGAVDANASTSSDVVGGLFQADKGGSGSVTNGMYGTQNYADCGHNASTVLCVGGYFETGSVGGGTQSITTMSPLSIKAITRGATTVTNLRGIQFINWAKDVSDTITNSSVIFADNTVDIGTTKYFINSASTSPSKFAGNIAVTDNAKGIILKSPDNTCHLIAVSNANALSASTVPCP